MCSIIFNKCWLMSYTQIVFLHKISLKFRVLFSLCFDHLGRLTASLVHTINWFCVGLFVHFPPNFDITSFLDFKQLLCFRQLLKVKSKQIKTCWVPEDKLHYRWADYVWLYFLWCVCPSIIEQDRNSNRVYVFVLNTYKVIIKSKTTYYITHLSSYGKNCKNLMHNIITKSITGHYCWYNKQHVFVYIYDTRILHFRGPAVLLCW